MSFLIRIMPPMVFIGLGLNDEKGLTLEGLEAARLADRVFAEFYTSKMPGLQIEKLEERIGKKIELLTRAQLEDESSGRIISTAAKQSVVLLVPGDPMIATTHVALRFALAEKGIESRIIHNASIYSAVCGATGLQNYKFGKSTTLPRDGPAPPSVLEAIRDNRIRGLHTLLLLELNSDGRPQLSIKTALSKLIGAQSEISDWLAVGVARIGCRDQQIRAARVDILEKVDFGPVPHSLVFPGKLHFMEANALRLFAGASKLDLGESL